MTACRLPHRYMVLLPALAFLAACLATTSGAPGPAGREYHVAGKHPNASDGNDGSAGAPWKTISRAAGEVRAGDTVWIHEGVYRETVRVDRSGEGFDRMIAFRAASGERVVVKGSEPLTGWVRAPAEPERPIWEVSWPFEGRFPTMVACDDAPLVPMNVPAATEERKPPKDYCRFFLGFGRGREAMFPGSFWYDEERKKLLVWLKGDADPNTHAMETAVRACWNSQGNYLLVEGIVFRYAPLVVPVGGIVFVMTGPGGGLSPAEGCIVRDCEISHGAFEGMYVRGGRAVDTVIEDCWVHHNGNGCGGFEGHGRPETDSWLVVRRCRLTDNNLFHWNSAWHAGGKHFGTRVLFDRCEFARSYRAPGLWFDCHTRDCIVNGCYAHDNGQFQLYYEIGETGAFLNNVVLGGPHCAAIGLNGSSRTLVAHNAVEATERGCIVGWEGNVEGQTARVTCHNSVLNNVFVGRGFPLLAISPEKDAARANTSDANLFRQLPPPAWLKPPTGGLVVENGPGKPVDLAEWQRARGFDRRSQVADPGVSIGRNHFARLEGSPSRAGGARLTPERIRDLFAVKPMPAITAETISGSIKEHRPPTTAFLEKVAELVRVPEGHDIPIGPIERAGTGEAIPVVNGGFEADALTGNATAPGVEGWAETEGVSVWHAAGTGLWNWDVPDGSNVLVLRPGLPGKEARLTQVLNAPLRPATRHELRIQAGQRTDQAKLPWPRVTLALYAGDSLLRAIDIPEPTIHPHHGVWVENVLTYTSPPGMKPGGRLKILLVCGGSGAAQACFDAVSLRAYPVGPDSTRLRVP